jgi:hypothetical protein
MLRPLTPIPAKRRAVRVSFVPVYQTRPQRARPSRRTGVPDQIKVKYYQQLPDPPTSAIVTRQKGKWFIGFHVAGEAAQRDSEALA